MKYILAIMFALLASPAAADPVSIVTGIVGLGSWLFGGTILANIVLSGLLVAAKYALTSIFQQKPKSQASSTETKYGENLVREVGLGVFGTMGHHVYRNAFDKGNHIVQDVFKLSDFRCLELLRVQMDGEWKSLSPDQQGDEGRIYGQRVLNVKDDGQCFVRFYHGTLDQAADPALIAYANPVGRWTSAHRGVGLCYAIVTTMTDVDNLTSVPNLMFEVRGAPLYDPRKDSSVGGLGSHRWDDQSTWEFSNNNAVMMYNLERGIYIGTEKIVGRGVAASRLPLSEWFTAMNICDEIMPDGSKRYTAALIASSGDGVTHETNMTPLREACAGSWIEGVSGEYPIVGGNQAVVATITDDDIALEKSFQLSFSRTRTELVNTVAASYVSPDLFYETTSLTTRIDALALAQDRERLASKVDFTAVTDHRVGDRLADIAIRASRYQANGSFTVHPKFLALQVGQWVQWQSDRYNRTIKFQVQSKSLGAMGSDGVRDVSISWQEVGDCIFDPTAYETNPPIPIPNGQPDYQAQLSNFNAIPNKVVGADGQEYPGIRLFWDEIVDTTVEGVEIQYWPENDPSQIFTAYVPRDVTVFQIVNGLTSKSEWNVRYRLRVAAGTRPVAWSAPVLVLTPETAGDNSPVDYGRLDDDLTGLINWITDDMRELKRQAQELATSTADNHNTNYAALQTIRRQLTSTYGTAKASWQEDILVATGPNSAIGQQLTQINVSLGTKADASTVTLLQSRVDGVEGDMTAISNAVTQVNASVDGNVSSATWRMTATSGSGGSSTKISAFARVGTSDSWKEAGWFVNVTSTSSQFVVIANQFAIANPGASGGYTYPFVVQNDEVYAMNMRLGTLRFDRLLSNNGKLDIRGDGGNAYIRIYV
ncbi:phage tail protein [Ochrobactrum chromiisoli]|uniref:Phage tail protein n=1 Tax=Ochrobactrum chromiisoli TaxID=2993941 RepID=A0ABT3QMA8_9HYPH|nr:phage tail protein [Ochrobactrum chromiisoli]MCX2696729.1 phage tail protein [Ochrobactrum chromiisoli]